MRINDEVGYIEESGERHTALVIAIVGKGPSNYKRLNLTFRKDGEDEVVAIDLFEHGRVATVRDPAGAVVSLSRPGEQFAAEVVNQDGAWTWNELVAPDLAAAVAFYRELLSWVAADIPGAVARTSFSLGDLLVGGGHAPIGPEDPTPRWTISFWVADADRCVERAQELGGGVVLPPMDLPVGRFAILSDPGGAAFTVAAGPGGPLRGVDGS